MNFTNNPYEKMMKQKPRPLAPSIPKAPKGSLLLRVPLLAGDQLRVLLPGAFENPCREVMGWPVN